MSDSHGKKSTVTRDLDLLRKLGYEPEEIGVHTVLRWWIGLGVFIVGSLLLTALIEWVFVPRGAEKAMNNPLTVARRLPAAPNPILQARPKQDMVDFREVEDSQLNGYRWTNRSKGRVAIPVSKAIDILAERGIPTPPPPRPTTPAAAPRGTTGPGAAGAGVTQGANAPGQVTGDAR